MRYFLVALVFAVIAVGGIVSFGLGLIAEPMARGTFGVGFIGAAITVAVGMLQKGQFAR